MHRILGKGQVSKVISDTIDHDSVSYDLGQWEIITNIITDVLHITIPYSDEFIKTVNKSIKVFSPNIVVIHSTVKPGTTKQIKGCKIIAYSPITGRHKDNFSKNVQNYYKFVACKDKYYNKVDEALEGFDTVHFTTNAEELEYAKVMSTNYMYWNLIYEKMIYQDCKKKGYDYDNVYKTWNMNYNIGIAKEHPMWRRPVYDHDESRLAGGHCLRPNLHLVDNHISMILKAYEKGDIMYCVSEKI